MLVKNLENKANQIRLDILNAIKKSTQLYRWILLYCRYFSNTITANILDPDNPKWEDRDRLY